VSKEERIWSQRDEERMVTTYATFLIISLFPLCFPLDRSTMGEQDHSSKPLSPNHKAESKHNGAEGGHEPAEPSSFVHEASTSSSSTSAPPETARDRLEATSRDRVQALRDARNAALSPGDPPVSSQCFHIPSIRQPVPLPVTYLLLPLAHFDKS
jgi:hypothetical protein